MFDRVPFGSARGIVGDCDRQTEGIAELSLQLGLPTTGTAAIAAAAIGEDQKFASLVITREAFAFPPSGNGMSGEGGGVVRDADENGSAVRLWVIDAVGDGYPGGIGAKIVIVHAERRTIPFGSGVLEVADQFPFLGIHADDW